MGGGIETMIDMIMDQLPLRLGDSLLDGVKLLSKLNAGPSFAEHGDDPLDVALGPLEPFHDSRMAEMRIDVGHADDPIPREGIGQEGAKMKTTPEKRTGPGACAKGPAFRQISDAAIPEVAIALDVERQVLGVAWEVLVLGQLDFGDRACIAFALFGRLLHR